MNYNSIDEILSAGTTNMTIIRNNTKNDDGTDGVAGVSWFTFNGTVASNIYVSGNSWIGFGSSNEHLKVNRRDGAMWYLYREEGTLYEYYNFLKIRFIGYSYYSQTSSSYKEEYDVILWDTGDISLHMISIPTANNNGIYALVANTTYNYTVSTSSPDVTFKKTDSGFTVSNSIIQLEDPYEKRYLIRSDSKYYTVENNNLTEIIIDTLTSDVFLNNGVENIPDVNLLLTLENLELLFWTDKEDAELKEGMVLTGAPVFPKIIYYDSCLISDGSRLKRVDVSSSDDVLFSITFDNGQTWKYYSNGKWITASSEYEGMNSNTLKNMPSTAWSKVNMSSNIKFKCVLADVNSFVGKMYLNIS